MPNFFLSVLCLCCWIALLPTGHAQKKLSDVDWERVQFKKLEKMAAQQQKLGRQFINDLQATCHHSAPDSSEFTFHTKTYRIQANIDSLWTAYLTADPAAAWKSKIISFGLLYAPQENQIYYADDQIDLLEESQMVFLNLRIWGMVNIAVAHRIDKIDPLQKRIRFCYLDCGKTRGSQEMSLHQITPQITEVRHHSYFKGDSKFRDKRLYPNFHEKAIDQFHANVERWLKQQQSN
ncbi:MAG: hypothetical protein AAFV95_05100 [Bacteroidota bacterium]